MAIRETSVTVVCATTSGSGVTEDAVKGVITRVYVDYLLKLAYTSGSVEPVPGDTIEGHTSNATGVVVAVPDPSSGSWAGGDAAGNLYIRAQSGTFQSENLDNNTDSNTNFATIAADSAAVNSTCDATIATVVSDPLRISIPILTLTDNITSDWYQPRSPIHAVADGSALAGLADYVTVNDFVKLSLAQVTTADAVRLIVQFDDERGY